MNRLSTSFFAIIIGSFLIPSSWATEHSVHDFFQAFCTPSRLHTFSVTATDDRFNNHAITLRTADNLVRNGILTLRETARANIVLCHPAAHSKDFMTQFSENVFRNCNCLRFDFRRHGENAARQCCTVGKKEVLEICAAVDFLKQHPSTKHLPIFGFGISLGGAALIEAEAEHHLFSGLILQSVFAHLGKQIRHLMPIFNYPPMSLLMFREPTRFYVQTRYRVRLYKINPEKTIQKLTIPIFLIHAQNDAFVPFGSFERLKKAAQHVIKTWTPATGLHTLIYETHPELFIQHCTDFISTVVAQSLGSSPAPVSKADMPESLTNATTTLCREETSS